MVAGVHFCYTFADLIHYTGKFMPHGFRDVGHKHTFSEYMQV